MCRISEKDRIKLFFRISDAETTNLCTLNSWDGTLLCTLQNSATLGFSEPLGSTTHENDW